MIIDTSALRILCKSILDKTEKAFPNEIDLPFSTYWTVPFKEGQSLFPPTPTVRDIRDRWKEIQKNGLKKEISPQEIQALGDLFIAIGMKLEQERDEKKRNSREGIKRPSC